MAGEIDSTSHASTVVQCRTIFVPRDYNIFTNIKGHGINSAGLASFFNYKHHLSFEKWLKHFVIFPQTIQQLQS